MRKPRLQLRRSRKIRDREVGLKEPSGLACDPATGNLWTVSDSEMRLFELDERGVLQSALDIPSGRADFEGIV
jgi:uncharacterized protein YjiK